jgi:anaerobic dimethyl sulfoxide reductase subunit B (iron-sulfur subunit)
MISQKQYGFFIDIDRCIKCHACEIACRIWNGITDPPYRTVIEVESGTYPSVIRMNISLTCMHCSTPPCLVACPAKAISKRDDGIVIVDSTKCIGCRLCTWVCPFGAPKFGSDMKIKKCNFCEDRPVGMPRACEEACPTEAIVCGPVNELEKVATERARGRLTSLLGARKNALLENFKFKG